MRLDRRRLVRLAGLVCLSLVGSNAVASDHLDAPARGDDPAVDLGDLYAWVSSGSTFTVALTVGPGLLPGEDMHWDRDVLYGIHFDEDRDSIVDRTMWIQFGQNPGNDELGVMFRSIPGGGDLVGPIETVIDGPGSIRAWAGVRDDPFVYDAQGWADSVATGDFAMDVARDAHAMTNVLAIVVELDIDAIAGGEPRIWATANRWPR